MGGSVRQILKHFPTMLLSTADNQDPEFPECHECPVNQHPLDS